MYHFYLKINKGLYLIIWEIQKEYILIKYLNIYFKNLQRNNDPISVHFDVNKQKKIFLQKQDDVTRDIILVIIWDFSKIILLHVFKVQNKTYYFYISPKTRNKFILFCLQQSFCLKVIVIIIIIIIVNNMKHPWRCTNFWPFSTLFKLSINPFTDFPGFLLLLLYF